MDGSFMLTVVCDAAPPTLCSSGQQHAGALLSVCEVHCWCGRGGILRCKCAAIGEERMYGLGMDKRVRG